MSIEDSTFVYSEVERETGSALTDPTTLERVRTRIVDAIRTAVDDASAEGLVVAMSGGLDSTVTAMLAVEAVGSDRVLGLGLPCDEPDERTVSEARTMADGLGIEFHELQLRPVLEAFEAAVTPDLEPSDTDAGVSDDRTRTRGNAIARLRMACAYYAANRRSRLVLGTANRSELLVGYVTKYGDAAADVYPLGDLYKTEVQALAEWIGIPRRIVSKEPSAGFREGQRDADDLGAPYEEIDPLLRRIVDEGASITDAADELGIDRTTARTIAWLVAETAHKRTVPPTPGVGDRPPFDRAVDLSG
ncbi:NAD+ synthase [Halopiger goleimassiliensis]|uniref:NAD+ synthase n=1 Tax=Halopiger goleimassiliensis TaxID=1293048 RepID=UPI000677897B|nr:NAD+ synthase [Halopiger goleimassiliensis]